jgi:hypothetical protein
LTPVSCRVRALSALSLLAAVPAAARNLGRSLDRSGLQPADLEVMTAAATRLLEPPGRTGDTSRRNNPTPRRGDPARPDRSQLRRTRPLHPHGAHGRHGNLSDMALPHRQPLRAGERRTELMRAMVVGRVA